MAEVRRSEDSVLEFVAQTEYWRGRQLTDKSLSNLHAFLEFWLNAKLCTCRVRLLTGSSYNYQEAVN